MFESQLNEGADLPPGAYLLPAADESHLLGMQLILNAHDTPQAVHRGGHTADARRCAPASASGGCVSAHWLPTVNSPA